MQNLDYFIKSIGIAIRSAQEETERYSLEAYKNWFVEGETEDGEATLKPKTITVSLPKNDGTYAEKEIPIIALLNHHSLILDETRIKMSLIARWDDHEKSLVVESGPIPKEGGESDSRSLDRCEVELIFKGSSSGEGIARYVDKFIRDI
jgi:hypothetical protein